MAKRGCLRCSTPVLRWLGPILSDEARYRTTKGRLQDPFRAPFGPGEVPPGEHQMGAMTEIRPIRPDLTSNIGLEGCLMALLGVVWP